MANGTVHKVEEVGAFHIARKPLPALEAGEVGYIIAGMKTVSDVSIGDTITLNDNPAANLLPGFKQVKPVVFSSIYPVAADDYMDLTEALEKYKLNDARPGLPERLFRSPGTGVPLRVFGTVTSGRSCRKGWSGSTTSPSS